MFSGLNCWKQKAFHVYWCNLKIPQFCWQQKQTQAPRGFLPLLKMAHSVPAGWHCPKWDEMSWKSKFGFPSPPSLAEHGTFTLCSPAAPEGQTSAPTHPSAQSLVPAGPGCQVGCMARPGDCNGPWCTMRLKRQTCWVVWDISPPRLLCPQRGRINSRFRIIPDLNAFWVFFLWEDIRNAWNNLLTLCWHSCRGF